MYKREVFVMVEEDVDIPKKMNISLGLPENQPNMSTKEITHLLIGGVSMLIKSCEHNDSGIKDYELVKEVIEHLNLEFASISSFNDIYTNDKYIEDFKPKKDE